MVIKNLRPLASESSRKADGDLGTAWERLANQQVKRRRMLVLLAMIAVGSMIWVGSAWPESGLVHQGLEWLGLALIIGAVLGRSACM